MSASQPPKVLILAAESGAGRRWAEALADSTSGVWLSPVDIPPGERPDVIVTDLAADEVARRTGLTLNPAEPSDVGQMDFAVVAIGPASWGDVALGADCTDRELALAALLVAQIARLRIERVELARIHEEVKQLAQTDPLTGLPNRRAWDRHFAGRLAHVHRPLWLAVVDLDNFKQVNDQLGMAAGDQVLAHTAGALAGQLRRGDVMARLGGDEFGLLLDDMTEDNLRRVFDRLLAAVKAASPEGGQNVTASIGYVSTGTGAVDAGALFAAAERAMRQAKQAGGNRALRG